MTPRYKLDPPLDQLVNFAACSQALAPKQIYGQYVMHNRHLHAVQLGVQRVPAHNAALIRHRPPNCP